MCQLEGAPQVRVGVEGEGVQVEPHRAREQHRILQDSKLQYRHLHFRALGLGPRKKFYWIKSAISKSFSGNRHDLRSNLCCSTCYLNWTRLKGSSWDGQQKQGRNSTEQKIQTLWLEEGRKHERHSPLPARTEELSDEQKVSRMLHTTGNILQSRWGVNFQRVES